MELFIALIFTLAIIILLFLALRKAVLWYFKIDERIELQKKQIDQLRRIADNTYRG